MSDENERTASEQDQIVVSPEEPAEAQAQKVEDVEEAPAHPLVEVRGCKVLCVRPSPAIPVSLPHHSLLSPHTVTTPVHGFLKDS